MASYSSYEPFRTARTRFPRSRDRALRTTGAVNLGENASQNRAVARQSRLHRIGTVVLRTWPNEVAALSSQHGTVRRLPSAPRCERSPDRFLFLEKLLLIGNSADTPS